MGDVITKATRVLKRPNGAEVRITAKDMNGFGLVRSIDVHVHHRESSNHEWVLCSNRPHPDWREMSIDDYAQNGRSEMLQTVSHAELLKVMGLIGKRADEVDPEEVLFVDSNEDPSEEPLRVKIG